MLVMCSLVSCVRSCKSSSALWVNMSLQLTTFKLVRLVPTEVKISLKGLPSRAKLCVESREEFLQGERVLVG